MSLGILTVSARPWAACCGARTSLAGSRPPGSPSWSRARSVSADLKAKETWRERAAQEQAGDHTAGTVTSPGVGPVPGSPELALLQSWRPRVLMSTIQGTKLLGSPGGCLLAALSATLLTSDCSLPLFSLSREWARGRGHQGLHLEPPRGQSTGSFVSETHQLRSRLPTPRLPALPPQPPPSWGPALPANRPADPTFRDQ